MTHYWGSEAIRRRLGCGSHHTLYRYIRQHGLPVYKRADPRNPHRVMLYASEAMILAWELAMSQDYRERLIADETVHDPVKVSKPSSATIQRRMRAQALKAASDAPQSDVS